MANVENIEADNALTATRSGLIASSSNAIEKIREGIDQPGFRRAFPTLLASITAVAAIVLYWGMQQPDMTTLYSSLPEAEKSKVLDSLRNMGVEVELDPVKVKAKTNPRRNESLGYRENCTNCVAAYDLRRRGYDVEAKPLVGGRPSRVMIMESYNMPDGSEMQFSDYLQRAPKIPKNRILKHIIDNNPVGSRGFIWGAWGRSRSGHIWNWEITEDRKVRFIEPQNPEPVSTRHYIKDITSTQYIRTDDLKPKPGVSKFVEDSRND